MSFIINYVIMFTGTLYFFAWIQITTGCHFLSVWRSFFGIYFKTRLLATDSLSVCAGMF